MKTLIYLSTLVMILGSCSGNKFLSRKYTSGRFVEHHKTIKHNTIYADTNCYYASATSLTKVKTSLPVLETEKLVENKETQLGKKDSIFYVKRRGPDKVIVVKNNLPDVKVYVNGKGKILKTQSVNKVQAKEIVKREIRKIKTISILSLCFCFIPVLGFVFSIAALRSIKRLKMKQPFVDLENQQAMAGAALGISLIPTLAMVALAGVMVYAIGLLLAI